MSQNYNKDSFDRFGDDLCQELLSYMAFKDRFRWESVSKQWQRVVFKSQLALNINRELIDDNFGQILNDVSFKVSEDNVHWISHLMAKFAKQMTSISFDLKHNGMIDMRYEWLEMCVHLTTIHILFTDLSQTRLAFSPGNDLHYKRLTSIHLTFNESNDHLIDINLSEFDFFAHKYDHNIKTIGFTFYSLTGDYMVNRLTDSLSRMPALIALKVKFNEFVDNLLPQIGHKCRQLKSLTVDTSHSMETFEAINEYFKQLKRLEINVWDSRRLSAHSLNSLKRLTHLKLFFVDTSFTDSFFINCHNKWPQLRYLRANRVVITDQLLNALSRLRHIRHMHLFGCPVPTPEAIQNVVINYPKIDCRLYSANDREEPQIEELFRKLMSGQSVPAKSSSHVKSNHSSKK
ncbi:unnamed protein product [Medioppia subpectinata]|uniref:F-box domain-containing protein n=1 Tax=Medioppia subpectinata TaxID=1979941 RepID=A0A7R9KEI1_9ACAR|nr:unnamed protein product [Medioppia subpectinata]CAG2101701.1 unnamed protein product [Medioppia subpectinata]